VAETEQPPTPYVASINSILVVTSFQDGTYSKCILHYFTFTLDAQTTQRTAAEQVTYAHDRTSPQQLHNHHLRHTFAQFAIRQVFHIRAGPSHQGTSLATPVHNESFASTAGFWPKPNLAPGVPRDQWPKVSRQHANCCRAMNAFEGNMELRVRAMAGVVFVAWLIWFCFWATAPHPTPPVNQPLAPADAGAEIRRNPDRAAN
jgi:hypothetical protein